MRNWAKSVEMLRLYANVEEIRQQGLCVGCGSCFVACPENAIVISRNSQGLYVPIVNNAVCNRCELCVKVCPGHFVDFNKLNEFVFGKRLKDDFLGNYFNCYLGYATDHRIRWAGQSGGLVTALLLFALEQGLINGAVVTRMSQSDPLSPETIVAESKEEILNASKSKYCPVPVNVALKEVLKKDGKYAIVGIPCQIHGTRKLEMVNSKLREKIILHLGLFCSHTLSFLANDFLLYKAGVRENDLDKFEYRSKEWRGWPGDVFFKLKDGTKKFLVNGYRTLIKPFFVPWRCRMCYDKLNELADISFGDAWFPELMNRKKGISVLISRTEIGERVLQEANYAGAIKIRKISRSKMMRSQRWLPRNKDILGAHLMISKLMGKGVPTYDLSLPRPRLMECFAAFFDYMNAQIPFNSITYFLLKHAPLSLLRLYATGTYLPTIAFALKERYS